MSSLRVPIGGFADAKSSDIKTSLFKIFNRLCYPLKWKMMGSLTDTQVKNVNYIKDIDIRILINDDTTFNDVLTIFNNSTKIFGLKLTYVTFINNSFTIDIIDQKDFSNIDFDKVQSKFDDLKKKNAISEDEYKSLLLQIKNPTLENLLMIEHFIQRKERINFTENDIKENKISLYGENVNLADYYNNMITRRGIGLVMRYMYFNYDTVLLIDVAFISRNEMKDYVKNAYLKKKTIYKSMFFNYYKQNYIKLFKGLKKVALNYNLKDPANQITSILNNDFIVHRVVLHKLKKLIEILDKKNTNINKKLILTALQNLIPLIKKTGFTVSDGEINWTLLYKNFDVWTNNKLIPFYNQWRQTLVKLQPEIDNAIPNEISKLLT